jgi:hypothetical protein
MPTSGLLVTSFATICTNSDKHGFAGQFAFCLLKLDFLSPSTHPLRAGLIAGLDQYPDGAPDCVTLHATEWVMLCATGVECV